MSIIWKDIPGFETKYQIGSNGTVKLLSNDKTRKEKIIRQRFHHSGYWYIKLWKDGISKTFQVHRLIAQAFIPNPEGKPCINHINGNKADNNTINLEWCSRSENGLHAYKLGLMKHTCWTILSDTQVLEILHKYNNCSKTQSELAREYSVKPHTIYYIVNGINRKSIYHQFKNAI